MSFQHFRLVNPIKAGRRLGGGEGVIWTFEQTIQRKRLGLKVYILYLESLIWKNSFGKTQYGKLLNFFLKRKSLNKIWEWYSVETRGGAKQPPPLPLLGNKCGSLISRGNGPKNKSVQGLMNKRLAKGVVNKLQNMLYL